MKKAFISLFAGLLLAVPGEVDASGSYRSKAPGAAKRKIDSAKYDVGKMIFNRKTKLGPSVEAAAAEQTRLLEGWQKQLPRLTRSRAKLPEFAGRLTAVQLDALKYYLAVRYKVK